MKTFKDLKFKPYPNCKGGIYARMTFSNGYGVSVIQGFGLDSLESKNEYELAILFNNKFSGETVFGCLSPDSVTTIMKKLQKKVLP